MRTQLKINGEMKDVEIENGEITIIEQEKKATGWERTKCGDTMHFVDSCGVINSAEENSEEDAALQQEANYFSNRKLAENINRMQTLQRKMFRWQAENDVCFETRMDAAKYVISNDSVIGTRACEIYADVGFLPCFSSRKKAEECIEVFKDELTWLFTEFKWRMDGD